MSGPSFEQMAPRYIAAWNNIHIVAGYDGIMDGETGKILAGMDRYTEVYEDTGVPPVEIGLMHKMESDCNFNAHLHNGDPLGRKTYHVPPGRPLGYWPPLNKPQSEWWHLSADDAIRMQGFDKITQWDIARIAYTLEAYNGWGYFYHGVPSAYLWSFSNQYRGGKYVSDGVWSSGAWSSQIGALTLLKWMLARDKTLQIVPNKVAPIVAAVQPAPAACPMCDAHPDQVAPVLLQTTPPKATPPADQPMPVVADSLFDPNYWSHRVIRALS